MPKVFTSSKPMAYANCAACQLLILTSFSWATSSLSPACDSGGKAWHP